MNRFKPLLGNKKIRNAFNSISIMRLYCIILKFITSNVLLLYVNVPTRLQADVLFPHLHLQCPDKLGGILLPHWIAKWSKKHYWTRINRITPIYITINYIAPQILFRSRNWAFVLHHIIIINQKSNCSATFRIFFSFNHRRYSNNLFIADKILFIRRICTSPQQRGYL